jgi:hypothetical protein
MGQPIVGPEFERRWICENMARCGKTQLGVGREFAGTHGNKTVPAET